MAIVWWQRRERRAPLSIGAAGAGAGSIVAHLLWDCLVHYAGELKGDDDPVVSWRVLGVFTHGGDPLWGQFTRGQISQRGYWASFGFAEGRKLTCKLAMTCRTIYTKLHKVQCTRCDQRGGPNTFDPWQFVRPSGPVPQLASDGVSSMLHLCPALPVCMQCWRQEREQDWQHDQDGYLEEEYTPWGSVPQTEAEARRMRTRLPHGRAAPAAGRPASPQDGGMWHR